MPIYEYQCQHCGHELEALQKISDEPLKDCPQCNQSELQKLVSAASFRLKGGGWYETDFKSGDKKHLAESDSKTKTSESSKTTGTKAEKKNSDTASSSGAGAGKKEGNSSANKSADKKSGGSAATKS